VQYGGGYGSAFSVLAGASARAGATGATFAVRRAVARTRGAARSSSWRRALPPALRVAHAPAPPEFLEAPPPGRMKQRPGTRIARRRDQNRFGDRP
jgi:hypothetical protein